MAFLYNILPEYTRSSDTIVDNNITGEVKILEEFLNSIDAEIFDVISDSIREILSFRDIHNIKTEYLPYFAYMLGYKWNNKLSLDIQKEILTNILDVYKRKGTIFSFHFGLYKIDPTISIYEPYRDIFEMNKSYMGYGFDIYNRWRYKLANNKKIINDSANNLYVINDNCLYKLNIDGKKIWEVNFENNVIVDICINLVSINKDNVYLLVKNENFSYLIKLDSNGNIIYNKEYMSNVKHICVTDSNNIYLVINEDENNDYIIKINGNSENVIDINDEQQYYVDGIVNNITCNDNYIYASISFTENIYKSNSTLLILRHNDESHTIDEIYKYVYSYNVDDNITVIKYDDNYNVYILINNNKIIKIDITYLNNEIIKDNINIYYFDICKFKSVNYLLLSTDCYIKIIDLKRKIELYDIKTIYNVKYILGKLNSNILYYLDDDIVSKNYYNMISGDFLTSREYYSNGIIVVETKKMSDAVKDIIDMVLPAGWKLLIEGTSDLYYSFHDKTYTKDNHGLFNFLDEYRKKYIDFYIYNDVLKVFEKEESENNKVQFYSGVQYHGRGHSNIVMLGKTFIINTNTTLYDTFNLNLYVESSDNLYTGFRYPFHFAQINNKQSIHETNDNMIGGLEFTISVPNEVRIIEMLLIGGGGGSSDSIELDDGSEISVGGGAGEIVKSVFYIDPETVDYELPYNHIITATAGYGGNINTNGNNSNVNISHALTNETVHNVVSMGGYYPNEFDENSMYYEGGYDYDNISHGADIYSAYNNWGSIDKLIPVYNSNNDNGSNIYYLTKNNNKTVNTAGSSSYDIGLGFKYSKEKIGSGGNYIIKTLNENLEYVAGKGGNGYIKIIMHY